ncbi:teneurin-m isoform X7 [Frankliniella occidentalis]|uniref:Tenascin-like protein n=1 Tax=Frankliniella occidentalis TaxID=133901 RepID=A0A9C6X665_FRAOC|nr:teneurin-m isoform X7 [Frankliniella occidentalis]
MSRMNGRSGGHCGLGSTLPPMSSLGGHGGHGVHGSLNTFGGQGGHGTLPNMANMTNLGVGLGGQDPDGEFEPSCLVRTPSGNVYIPTDVSKNSQLDYKSNSSCSSPSKGENLKKSERGTLPFGAAVPVLPVRNNLRRPNSGHFSQPRLHFRKGLAARCSWKCTSICFISITIVLIAIIAYMMSANLVYWSYQSSKSCTVHVNENAEPFPKTTSPEVSVNRSSTNRPRPATSSGGKTFVATTHMQPGLNSKSRKRRDTRTKHEVVSSPYSTSVITDNPPSIESPASVESIELESDHLLLHDGDLHGVGYSLDAFPSMLKEDDVEENGSGGSLQHAVLEYMSSTEPSVAVTNQINLGGTNKAPNNYLHTFGDINPTSAGLGDTSEVPFVDAEVFDHQDGSTKSDVEREIPPAPLEIAVTDDTLNNDLDKIKENFNSEEEKPQQDSPVYAYGSDNIEFIELKQDPELSVKGSNEHVDDTQYESTLDIGKDETFQSSGENEVNGNIFSGNRTSPNLVLNVSSDSVHVENTSQTLLQSRNTHKTNLESFSPPSFSGLSPNQKTLAHKNVTNQSVLLETSHHTKRVLVNVTIATEENGDNQEKHQQVYVLSVAVPSDEDSSNVHAESIDLSPPQQNIASVHLGLKGGSSNLSQHSTLRPSGLLPTPSSSTHQSWGGHCKCSCPCLDVKSSSKNEQHSNLSVISGNHEVADPTNVNDTRQVDVNTDRYTPKLNHTSHTANKDASETDNLVTSSQVSPLFIESKEILNTTLNISDVTENSLYEELFPTFELEGDSFEDTSPNPTTEPQLDTTTQEQCVQPTQPPPIILLLEGAKTVPMRTFPPDGTTFAQVQLGQRLSQEIPAYGYWNMQFYQSRAAFVSFDWSIPRGASIGVYARRNALPTHTHYDILEVLSGFKPRQVRSTHPLMKKEVSHYLEQGHWFLSLYNDDGDPQEVSFMAAVSEDLTTNCPNGCSGKGECILGHCQCKPGFGGEDCSESVCPVLCSQRGEYINGECHCNPGWKGKECSLRHDECEVPDCNGHGHCTNGKCTCVHGFKGKFCDLVDCPHPNCTGHGYCTSEGSCLCKRGWKGADCSVTDSDALQCLPNCSGHGSFDLETQTCTCERMWSGDDCSKGNKNSLRYVFFKLYFSRNLLFISFFTELCDKDCGPHGHCMGDSCICDSGWSGEYCMLKQCDQRCNEHGQCKNGTCLCVTGWNGKHCTMEGCPKGCAGHGQCRVNGEGLWECRCYEGWDGKDCGVPLEQSCSDQRDNDKDNLIDCQDPECCTNPQCRSSQLCITSPKPIDILLRKQPPAITASFFERMKFLIEEGSLQRYAKQDALNESRSAVVRGRVVTSMGMGMMGVRVGTTNINDGYTMTREDGWFDLLLNGGGAVTLKFGRSPFPAVQYVVNVPWNEVVVIDTVIMEVGDDRSAILASASPPSQACQAHDYDIMKPVVLATWKHGFQGACPDKSAILVESQVVQESIQIPGTGLNLVYHSSRSPGYLSTIQLQLTPEAVPPALKLIHLRITIEGILFEKVFEADPVIKFTYAWNRLNVYRQRVYGVTTAVVKVGYEYSNCSDIIWDVQTTKLSGHDMSISEVGGWNLDIHHRYNFHEGILQKGDGSNLYLKQRPHIIRTILGDGHQRSVECPECEGESAAGSQRLLAPVALAAAPDGSLFVGDFNLVRRILTDGTVRTVVRLNATRVAYRYHLSLSPLDNTLYISDPEAHQIIRVRNVDDYSDPDHNWEPAVGSGERCLPGDEAHCGDGALARDAKLAYPKGVAVAADNVLYFADGTNIRMVDRDGIVTTVIGNHMHKSHWKSVPCEGTLRVEEVHLRWPTDLAINPLDNSLHIIDDHVILKLTSDGRVKVAAGRPILCTGPPATHDSELATHAALVMPQSIAFGPSGDLYVAESDSQRINRVRVIGTDGKISHFAGAESKCNCLDRGCDCFEEDHYLAATAKFNTISSITATPDGVVHIADQANYRIRSVTASIPEASATREYEIYQPETQEVYVFNRFGQHIATKNLLTGETLYLFTYNVNTSNGKLSTVTDAQANKVFLLRDYSSQVNSIENTKGQKCRLRMSRMRLLAELSTPDNYNVSLDYHGPTGLLKSKLDSTGRSYVYSYDEFGRLTSAVTPTGRIVGLEFDLSQKGAMVRVKQDGRRPESLLIKGSSVVTKLGEARQKTVLFADGSVATTTPWGHTISTDTVPYNVLSDIDPMLGESYPVPAKQRTEVGGDLANSFEWRYFRGQSMQGQVNTKTKAIAKVVGPVGRKLRVNGENILALEYDKDSNSVAVFMDDRVELINITYDRTARPIKWGPRNGIFSGVELEYDRFSRLTSWKWGELSETYGFDRAGRLNEIRYADGSSLQYAFKDQFSSLPLKVTTPRGSDYLLQYDEAGALQSLTTPRGHIHAFSLQTSLGFFKYQYYSPVNRHPFEILYNDDGQIIAKVYPHQSGRVAYVYDQTGKLDTVLAGMSSIHYSYQENSNVLKYIDIIEPHFELKHEFKYHGGLLKNEKLQFGSKTGLDNTHYRYQYDGNARLSAVDVDINSKQLPQIRLKHNQNLGMLESISDLRIFRNMFNKSVMQDNAKQFLTIIDYDSHGRIKSVLINIKAFDVFRLELEYDKRNRIKTQQFLIGRTSSMDRITYNADGHVMEVVGSGANNWKFVYDENGNVIGAIDQGHKQSLGYDLGDRVVQVGDVELINYDSRGFVIRRGEQKYRYNPRGQLTHAFEQDKFSAWYAYDDRGRMISWRDSQDNITQLLYAYPHTPDLVSHVHFPKTGRTFRLLYDDRKFLIAVETLEQRFYVACDQNGSPLALFDINGNIIKEIRRTPFGKVQMDSNPDFYLPVDFHGGLLDPHTQLIYINGRLYDPSIGQWMTPAWEELASQLTAPTDVFIYRFHNNDPINPPQKRVNYMTDLQSWLNLFGYDINSMLGSLYTSSAVYHPVASVRNTQLAPEFAVMSGLQCLVDKVSQKFSELGFVPEPLLKMESRTRNLLPRVAYRRAIFGEGVLISRGPSGRALVSVVDNVNGVLQDVVTSVFNNSHFLDIHFSLHDQDVFYFVKDNPLKIRDDMEELRRLGAMFNVSTHETADHGQSGTKELRLHNPDAAVFIRYGTDPDVERQRILKHAHKRAVEQAWKLEKAIVSAGFRGRGDWSPEEREELISNGVVGGWEGVELHTLHRYPQLADDPGNVAFRRDANRKRRKSGNGKHRIHRHDS